MIPHENGLESYYTTPDAKKDTLFEKSLYENGHFNYQMGWRLYLPGEEINNLKIFPFDDASKCNIIDSNHILQKPLIYKCRKFANFYDKFCPLYCTKINNSNQSGNDFDYILYRGKRKLKIKACSNYTLEELLNNLREYLLRIDGNIMNDISPNLNEPILLIPFTCNAIQNKTNPPNEFDAENTTNLSDIYHELFDKKIQNYNSSTRNNIELTEQISNNNNFISNYSQIKRMIPFVK